MKKFFKRTAALAVTAALTASLAAAMPASAELSSDTAEFMESLGAGWVLGNALDSTGGSNDGNSLDAETSWGNPYTTKEMIEAVHDAGFETIRIPVSWGNHTTGDDYTIDSEWMARVKEIVDWAIDDGMHVILNVHHDNSSSTDSTIYYYPDEEHTESSVKFLTSVWSQIAEEFKDYDENLIFETLNEPRLKGTSDEWWIDANNPSSNAQEAITAINTFNQEIVNTIRASGSENSDRYIICPGYCASLNGVLTSGFELPKDTADNKLIVSVHAYTPYGLCLGSSTDNTTEFTVSAKEEIKATFDSLKENFTDNGIPCIIGEMGISNKNNNEDRTEWASYFYTLSNEYNIPCMLWDNNVESGSENDSENHMHLDRSDCTWNDPDVIGAIMTAMEVNNGGDNSNDSNDSNDSTDSVDSTASSAIGTDSTADSVSSTAPSKSTSTSSDSTDSSTSTKGDDGNPTTGLEAVGASLAVVVLALAAVARKRK